MLKIHEQQLIADLFLAGESALDISKRINRSLGTVYKYKPDQSLDSSSRSTVLSIETTLNEFHDLIDQRIARGERNRSKIFRELQKKGYTGSYAHINTYVRENITRKPYKPAVQLATGPGEEAQVDWGTFGTIVLNGRKEHLHAFVYILSYSRMLYVEFAIHQNQQVLQRAHIHAFERLGIPQTIKYDNMKTVVLKHIRFRNGDPPEITYNPAFLDFARYYKFTVEACSPYWPRSKGKVEASVKFVRHSFMEGLISGKSFRTIDEINELARDWLDNTANVRIHRATKTRPFDLWQKEKDILSTIKNIPIYNTSPITTRSATKDALVQYKNNLYSVPVELSQKRLYLREVEVSGQQFIEIYYKNRLSARHQISLDRGKWIMDTSHVADIPKKKTHPSVEIAEIVSDKMKIHVQERDLTYYNQLIPNIGDNNGQK